MSFTVHSKYAKDPEVKEIFKECTLTPKKTIFEENNKEYRLYKLYEKKLFLPLLYDDTPLQEILERFEVQKFSFKHKLFTIESDPKKFRDQDVICKTAIKHLSEHRSVFLNLCTGFGKTKCSAYIASKLGLRTAVIVQMKDLREEWKKEFEDSTDMTAVVVKTKRDVEKSADVYIFGPQMITKFEPTELSFIGTVIYDESHMYTELVMTECMFYFQPAFLIGLTATPDRADGLDCLFVPFFGSKKHHLVRNEVKVLTVIKHETGIAPKDIKMRMYKGRLVKNVVDMQSQLSLDKERQLQIVEYCKKYSDKKILILCSRQDECRSLVKMIGKEACIRIGDEKPDYSKSRVLVAGIKCFGTGVNDVRKPTLLILSADVKNVKQFEGRIRENNAIVIDFVDNDEVFDKHFEQRERFYLSRGATIVYPNGDKVNLKNPTAKRTKDNVVLLHSDKIGGLKLK